MTPIPLDLRSPTRIAKGERASKIAFRLSRWKLCKIADGVTVGVERFDRYTTAFDEGLMWATGQCERALECVGGRDFKIVADWHLERA